MNDKDIKWQWDGNYKSNFVESNGFRFIYSFDKDNDTGKIIQENSFGDSKQLWEHQEAIIYSASLLICNNMLYIGLFSRTFTGCRALAFDLSSEHMIWKKPVLGLGSIGHSRYNNDVQIQMIENQLVVFGWESGGKYIEILDPKNGNLISNRLEPNFK